MIAACAEIEGEILRFLTEKLLWETTRAHAALETVLARAIRVRLRGTVKERRDPNHDMFPECAARAHADVLVAGPGSSGSRLLQKDTHSYSGCLRQWRSLGSALLDTANIRAALARCD